MKAIIIFLITTGLASLAIKTHSADSSDQPGFYLIGDIGPNLMQKVSFERILGVDATASPAVDFHAGVRGTVGVGYTFMPTLAAEGELGFSYNESKTYSGVLGGVPLNGSIRLW